MRYFSHSKQFFCKITNFKQYFPNKVFATNSKKNVCYITYAFKDVNKSQWGFFKDVKHVAQSSRLEFVARIVWQLITQVYENNAERIEEEVELGGFSYGVQMDGM